MNKLYTITKMCYLLVWWWVNKIIIMMKQVIAIIIIILMLSSFLWGISDWTFLHSLQMVGVAIGAAFLFSAIVAVIIWCLSTLED